MKGALRYLFAFGIAGLLVGLGGLVWSNAHTAPASLVDKVARHATPTESGHRKFDPAAACAHLLDLPGNQRLSATAQLIISLSDQPDQASDLAQQLCASDPTFIREHGALLIAALVESGHGPTAVRFASAGGPESVLWLDAAFSLWATHSPAEATRAALVHADAGGLRAASHQWAQRDPAALAEFAIAQTSGPAQTLVLEQALSHWLERDSRSAAAWLKRHDALATPD